MHLCLEDIEEAVSADLLPSLGALKHCPSSMAKSTRFSRHVDDTLVYVGLKKPLNKDKDRVREL